MLSQSLQVGLPRRVTAYYLLFGTAAIIWLGLAVYHASTRVAQDRTETSCLRILGRVTRALNLEYLQHGDANLQSVVEHHRTQNRFAYLAVVDLERKYTAHSSPELVGTNAGEPVGASETWGNTQRVRFVNEDSVVLQEYRAPLHAGDRRVGEVRLAVVEPSAWHTFWTAARYAPLVVLGPLAFMAVGAVVLGKLTRPVAAIESQLRVAAMAPSMTGCALKEVAEDGAAALGWNRLVEDWAADASRNDLHERLSESLGALRSDRLERVLNGLSDGVATTDSEGRVTFSNMALTALVRSHFAEHNMRVEGANKHGNGTGKSTGRNSDGGPSTLIAALGLAWTLPEQSPLVNPDADLRQVVAELEGPPGGERRVLRVTRSPLGAEGGQESTGHLWTLRDITQQKMAEEMRTQFVDTATHELRTPLANIKAYAETLVLAKVPDVEQQKEFLNTINTEATRLARFVDDLLSVSSMEVGSLSLSKQNTDVARLLGEVITKARPQMEQKSIAFETMLPDKLPEMQLDKDKIAATLVNLLGNAAKYTPTEARVALRVTISGEQLGISIEDTGFGIAEEELPHLFDKFFRSDDPRVREETGTGLGLSLANEVIRLHGGQITVESELNKGSTFIVTLPVV